MTYTAGLIALREHGHLGFDAVLTKFPPLIQRILLVIAHILMIGMMWLFLEGSWQQTVINLGNMAPASGISLGALYGRITSYNVCYTKLLRLASAHASR